MNTPENVNDNDSGENQPPLVELELTHEASAMQMRRSRKTGRRQKTDPMHYAACVNAYRAHLEYGRLNKKKVNVFSAKQFIIHFNQLKEGYYFAQHPDTLLRVAAKAWTEEEKKEYNALRHRPKMANKPYAPVAPSFYDVYAITVGLPSTESATPPSLPQQRTRRRRICAVPPLRSIGEKSSSQPPNLVIFHDGELTPPEKKQKLMKPSDVPKPGRQFELNTTHLLTIRAVVLEQMRKHPEFTFHRFKETVIAAMDVEKTGFMKLGDHTDKFFKSVAKRAYFKVKKAGNGRGRKQLFNLARLIAASPENQERYIVRLIRIRGRVKNMIEDDVKAGRLNDLEKLQYLVFSGDIKLPDNGLDLSRPFGGEKFVDEGEEEEDGGSQNVESTEVAAATMAVSTDVEEAEKGDRGDVSDDDLVATEEDDARDLEDDDHDDGPRAGDDASNVEDDAHDDGPQVIEDDTHEDLQPPVEVAPPSRRSSSRRSRVTLLPRPPGMSLSRWYKTSCSQITTAHQVDPDLQSASTAAASSDAVEASSGPMPLTEDTLAASSDHPSAAANMADDPNVDETTAAAGGDTPSSSAVENSEAEVITAAESPEAQTRGDDEAVARLMSILRLGEDDYATDIIVVVQTLRQQLLDIDRSEGDAKYVELFELIGIPEEMIAARILVMDETYPKEVWRGSVSPFLVMNGNQSATTGRAGGGSSIGAEAAIWGFANGAIIHVFLITRRPLTLEQKALLTTTFPILTCLLSPSGKADSELFSSEISSIAMLLRQRDVKLGLSDAQAAERQYLVLTDVCGSHQTEQVQEAFVGNLFECWGYIHNSTAVAALNDALINATLQQVNRKLIFAHEQAYGAVDYQQALFLFAKALHQTFPEVVLKPRFVEWPISKVGRASAAFVGIHPFSEEVIRTRYQEFRTRHGAGTDICTFKLRIEAEASRNSAELIANANDPQQVALLSQERDKLRTEATQRATRATQLQREVEVVSEALRNEDLTVMELAELFLHYTAAFEELKKIDSSHFKLCEHPIAGQLQATLLQQSLNAVARSEAVKHESALLVQRLFARQQEQAMDNALRLINCPLESIWPRICAQLLAEDAERVDDATLETSSGAESEDELEGAASQTSEATTAAVAQLFELADEETMENVIPLDISDLPDTTDDLEHCTANIYWLNRRRAFYTRASERLSFILNHLIGNRGLGVVAIAQKSAINQLIKALDGQAKWCLQRRVDLRRMQRSAAEEQAQRNSRAAAERRLQQQQANEADPNKQQCPQCRKWKLRTRRSNWKYCSNPSACAEHQAGADAACDQCGCTRFICALDLKHNQLPDGSSSDGNNWLCVEHTIQAAFELWYLN